MVPVIFFSPSAWPIRCRCRRINRAFLSFDWVNDEQCDPIYLAAVESVEEAVVNALLAAEDMNTLRPAGHICRALDHDQLMAVMKQHGRGGG